MASKTKKPVARRNSPSAFEHFTRLKTPELAAETKSLDREFVTDEFSKPDAKSKSAWNKFKRKVGRPRKGRGSVRVSVSMERGLLAAVDKLAKRKKLKRAELVAGALASIIDENR